LIVLCPSLGLQRRVNGASNEQARILLALILFAVSFPSRVLAQNEDKRAFGVLPNYRTAEASVPFQSLTTKQKFKIRFRSLDVADMGFEQEQRSPAIWGLPE
jgi:hypothetical protein